jgi:protein CpxP
MKKLVLVCAFVLGVSAVSFAQGRMRMTPEKQIEALKTTLSLTDDQVTKATAIVTTQAKVQDSIRTAANGDMATARPAMMAVRKKTSEKILTILTPDQATIYKKQLADMAAAQAARQQGGN